MQDGCRIFGSGKYGKMAKKYQHHKLPSCLGYPKHEGKDEENLTHFFRHYHQLKRRGNFSKSSHRLSFYTLRRIRRRGKTLFPLQKNLFNKEKLFDIPFLSKSRKEESVIFLIVSVNTIRIFTNSIRKPSSNLIVFITQKGDRYAQHIEGGKRKPPSATKNKNSIYKSR